jgi:small subunit ribosomal protein S20
MPIKHAAKKYLRKSRKRALINLKVREDIKTLIKQTRKAIDAKQPKEKILELLKKAQKSIDKAAQKGVIKKNTAGRKLSRLIKYYKKGGKAIEKKESTSAKATADKEKK